jgi:hypothetical protein
MNVKEIREVLIEIGKLAPHEAKALFERASDKTVSDEELGKTLKSRITKTSLLPGTTET